MKATTNGVDISSLSGLPSLSKTSAMARAYSRQSRISDACSWLMGFGNGCPNNFSTASVWASDAVPGTPISGMVKSTSHVFGGFCGVGAVSTTSGLSGVRGANASMAWRASWASDSGSTSRPRPRAMKNKRIKPAAIMDTQSIPASMLVDLEMIAIKKRRVESGFTQPDAGAACRSPPRRSSGWMSASPGSARRKVAAGSFMPPPI